MEKWINNLGEDILKDIGIAPNQKIVDFGFGKAVYVKICLRIIGEKGKIYAIEKQNKHIKNLKKFIKENNINNVYPIENTKNLRFPINNKEIDVILFYDVFHLLKDKKQERLLKESSRVLKDSGFISFHLTHIKSEDIIMEEMKAKLAKYSFQLTKKLNRDMFHMSWIEKNSLILNFTKN